MPLIAQVPGTERKFNRDVSTSYAFDSSDFGRNVIAGVAGFQIVVQRIELGVTTDDAATQLFRTSEPKSLCRTVASPGLGPIAFDFGEDGYVCADGTTLVHQPSASGMAASVVVIAYMRPTPDVGIVANVAGVRGKTF